MGGFLEGPAPKLVRGPRCDTGKLVAALPVERGAALTRVLAEGVWPLPAVERELVAALEGDDLVRLVGVPSLTRHRRMLMGRPNGCRCDAR